MKKTLNINGAEYVADIGATDTLLDVLREHLDLTGTKKGCDHGQCGCCTVHVDGKRVLACLQLCATVQGPVTTIEGIGTEADPHPMQTAFLRHDAYQCGYCTPGQIMSAIACVNEGQAGTEDQIKTAMSGNLCRCAAYENIRTAIADAAQSMDTPA